METYVNAAFILAVAALVVSVFGIIVSRSFFARRNHELGEMQRRMDDMRSAQNEACNKHIALVANTKRLADAMGYRWVEEKRCMAHWEKKKEDNAS